eukprot:gene5138-biopygen12991
MYPFRGPTESTTTALIELRVEVNHLREAQMVVGAVDTSVEVVLSCHLVWDDSNLLWGITAVARTKPYPSVRRLKKATTPIVPTRMEFAFGSVPVARRTFGRDVRDWKLIGH